MAVENKASYLPLSLGEPIYVQAVPLGAHCENCKRWKQKFFIVTFFFLLFIIGGAIRHCHSHHQRHGRFEPMPYPMRPTPPEPQVICSESKEGGDIFCVPVGVPVVHPIEDFPSGGYAASPQNKGSR
jgi:hypothetical protein